jgi:hypothetical protein
MVNVERQKLYGMVEVVLLLTWTWTFTACVVLGLKATYPMVPGACQQFVARLLGLPGRAS